MDWTGGPSNPSIRAGHLPASSLINRLSTSVTSCPFPCAPDYCRRHHPPLPVCLSVTLPFVPIYLPLPAVCLVENRRLAPSLPCPLHPSEDTRKQSLRTHPRISSRDHPAPSVARPSLQRKPTTESEHTATRSSAASPPHITMAESSSADAGETRPTSGRLPRLIGSCYTRIASVVDLFARLVLILPSFP